MSSYRTHEIHNCLVPDEARIHVEECQSTRTTTFRAKHKNDMQVQNAGQALAMFCCDHLLKNSVQSKQEFTLDLHFCVNTPMWSRFYICRAFGCKVQFAMTVVKPAVIGVGNLLTNSPILFAVG